MRGNLELGTSLFSTKWKYGPSRDASKEEIAAFYEAVELHRQNGIFRRKFICENCYQRLDNRWGVAECPTPRGPEAFNLAGKSRGGKAAVYDFAKWNRYQKRLH